MSSGSEIKLSVSTGTFVRFWLVILGFTVLAAAIWIARMPLIMLAASFFLALVLNRPVSFLARHLPGRSRTIAILVSYLIVAMMIGILLVTVVPIFVKQTSSFLNNLPNMANQLHSNSKWLNDLLAHYDLTAKFNKWTTGLEGQLGGLASSLGSSFISAMTNTFTAIGNLFLVLFATFFMLVEAPYWERKFWRLAYKDPIKRRHHKFVARKMYDVISGYVTGQATVGLISATFTAFLVAILASVFQFDITLVWPCWITIFLMIFVPMFGPVIGGGVVSLLLLVYSLPAAIIYLVVFTIEQQVKNKVVQPRVQSKHMEISALLVLIAMTLGLQVGGILGALVAIPLAGCTVVLVRDLFQVRNMTADSQTGYWKNGKIDRLLDSYEPIIFIPSERKYAGVDILSPTRKRRGRSSKLTDDNNGDKTQS